MTDDLGRHLQDAADAWRAEFRREMTARGFVAHNGAAGELLMHLTPDSLSQTELTARVGLSKQAVQQLLDQLEAQKYLHREPDPADKRAKRVVLSDYGKREFAERQKVLAVLNDRTQERLGKKLLAKLDKALRRLGDPKRARSEHL